MKGGEKKVVKRDHLEHINDFAGVDGQGGAGVDLDQAGARVRVDQVIPISK